MTPTDIWTGREICSESCQRQNSGCLESRGFGPGVVIVENSHRCWFLNSHYVPLGTLSPSLPVRSGQGKVILPMGRGQSDLSITLFASLSQSHCLAMPACSVASAAQQRSLPWSQLFCQQTPPKSQRASAGVPCRWKTTCSPPLSAHNCPESHPASPVHTHLQPASAPSLYFHMETPTTHWTPTEVLLLASLIGVLWSVDCEHLGPFSTVGA